MPRQLAVVRSYAELHAAIRARVEELDVSRLCLDDAAGFTGGYASKLLAPRPTKLMGKMSLGIMLGALGLALVVVEDPVALARIKPKLQKRRWKPNGGFDIEHSLNIGCRRSHK